MHDVVKITDITKVFAGLEPVARFQVQHWNINRQCSPPRASVPFIVSNVGTYVGMVIPMQHDNNFGASASFEVLIFLIGPEKLDQQVKTHEIYIN